MNAYEETKYLRRSTLRYPAMDSLDVNIIRQTADAERLLALSVGSAASDIGRAISKIEENGTEVRRVLRHYLSDYISRNTTAESKIDRCALEFPAYLSYRHRLMAELATDKGDITPLLLDIARCAASPSVYQRSNDIYISPDMNNNVIVLPSADAALNQIQMLPELYREYASRPVLCATLCMVTVLNSHFLSDGNGRLSRILFNSIIFHNIESDHYIPLHEFFITSDGGFEIRLRMAEIQSKWHDIIGMMSSIITLFSKGLE